MLANLITYIGSLDHNCISNERKIVLQNLAEAIKNLQHAKKAILLNFVCTHNSRRSHLTQIWAQTMASYYQIENVSCYSSGTEVSAIYPSILETLKVVGFEIDQLSISTNPIYSIKYDWNQPAIIGFSKQLDHPFNPKDQFIAIMTCSQADKDCPLVLGAQLRVKLNFEDPKAFDNTDQEVIKYEERSRQIATEMSYLFKELKKWN